MAHQVQPLRWEFVVQVLLEVEHVVEFHPVKTEHRSESVLELRPRLVFEMRWCVLPDERFLQSLAETKFPAALLRSCAWRLPTSYSVSV